MRITRREFLKISGGALFLSHWIGGEGWGNTSKIPVLLYHDISETFRDDYTVSPGQFAAQMEWLYEEGYQTLFLNEITSLKENEYRKVILLTFDDGYASFLDFAFPLLQVYQFKATINFIGGEVGKFIHLGGNRPTMSWDEYRYLLKSGLVDLGCHTYHLHFKSGVLSFSEDTLRRDLKLFQEEAQHRIGRTLEILSWPYGIFNDRSIRIAKGLGFKYFLTSKEGFFKRASGIETIPRLNINYRLDLISFRHYIEREEI